MGKKNYLFSNNPVGSVIEHKGSKIEVVKDTDLKGERTCTDCFFDAHETSCKDIACLESERKDNTNVMFKAL